MTSKAEYIRLAEKVMLASARCPKAQINTFISAMRLFNDFYTQTRARFSITQLSSLDSRGLAEHMAINLTDIQWAYLRAKVKQAKNTK